MRVSRIVKAWAVTLASVNLILPLHQVQAAGQEAVPPRRPTTSNSRVVTHDVALDGARQLHGQLVDRQGNPLANRIVWAAQANAAPLQTVTDEQGRFAVPGVRGGICQLQSGGSVTLCRCWANNTAPPAAVQELLVVSDGQTQRGQKPIGELLSGPVVIGLIIAAAIIIPIAVHNSQRSAS